MWISTLFCFQNECRQSCRILLLEFGKYLDKDHCYYQFGCGWSETFSVFVTYFEQISCGCGKPGLVSTGMTPSCYNSGLLFLEGQHTRTRSSLAFLLMSFFYSLNFGYFRYFLFILDLDTICIIYISMLYCSFLGSIARTVPSAL